MMRDMLADPETTEMVLVTLPEELPTTETEETLEWLGVRESDRQRHDWSPIGSSKSWATARPRGVRSARRLSSIGRSGPTNRSGCDAFPLSINSPICSALFTPGEVAARMCDEFEAIT